MKVLIACEFSGRVRDAFLDKGHDAYSCDILPSTTAKNRDHHIQGYAEDLLDEEWDLVIAHPPCTYLANLGVRWFKRDGVERRLKLIEACDFFLRCLNANSPRICVENPIMHKYAKERIGVDPTQIIQPWMFGHGETKATCLWLKGLPNLVPTNVVSGRYPKSHLATGRYQQKIRSVTPVGIAQAMAEQWG